MQLRHTDSARTQAIDAARALDLARGYRQELRRLAELMLLTPLTQDAFWAFLDGLLPTPKPKRDAGRIANQRGITMAENAKGVIAQVYAFNDRQRQLEGTLWGAVQACAFYANHLSINRNTPEASADENRFKRLTGEQNLGSRAFVHATRLLRELRPAG
jgi:hypothetical protein